MAPHPPPIDDEAVFDVIRAHLPRREQAVALSCESDLWQAGMDSLSSVAVMVAVENAYDVEFPDELLTRAVFTSAASIAAALRTISESIEEREQYG